MEIHVAEKALFSFLCEEMIEKGLETQNVKVIKFLLSSLVQPRQKGLEALGKLQWMYCMVKILVSVFMVSGIIYV